MNKKRLTYRILFFILPIFLFIETPTYSQDTNLEFQVLIHNVVYSIITGEERKSDSLLNEFSIFIQNHDNNAIANDTYLNFKSLYAIFFHYDYLLDSLHDIKMESDDPQLLHIRKYIESEYYFNNGDWNKSMDSSFDFSIDDLKYNIKERTPILYALAIANVIIGRDNNLKRVDTSIYINFYDVLNYLNKNSLDSLNTSILIKFFWASNILNSTAQETRRLEEIIFHRLKSISIEDLAYYESVYSTYALQSHSFYLKQKNVKNYDEITESISVSKRGYFIQNKWYSHLLSFGLFGDDEDEDQYFKIEMDYYNTLNKVIPYYNGLRLIRYGIHYGPTNNNTSETLFSRFYEYMQSDSLIRYQVVSLLKYASFEDISQNMNTVPNALINFIENSEVINKTNSRNINMIYVFGYIDHLELNKQYKKIDSLVEKDSIVNSYRNEILSNPTFAFLKSYLSISDSVTCQKYLSLKDNFRNLLKDSGRSIIKILIGDVIEFATYYNDINFADSLLRIYEAMSLAEMRKLYTVNRRKSDLGPLLKSYYVERTFISLFNKTHNNSYLIELLKFKLIKEKLINYSAFADRTNDKIIDSLERELIKDNIIKDFKFATQTYNENIDFNYFQTRANANNKLIDSLLADTYTKTERIFDTSKLISTLLGNIEDKSIVLLGLASRRKPDDLNLASYILAIQKNIDSLRLIEVEDSIFSTPYGNYFDVAPNEEIKKRRLNYLLKNINGNNSIRQVQNICGTKDRVLITGTALIDQIPFNIILSKRDNHKKVYQLGNLITIFNDIKGLNDFDFSQNKNATKILALGGAVFNNSDSPLVRSMLQYLPGSFREVEYIRNTFDSCCFVRVLIKDSARKENFISEINRTSYSIIHLATHSFFVEYDNSQNPFVTIPVSILPDREVRSAMYFTGGGDFQKYDSIERLKSYLDRNLILGEMVYLPLYNTKLVVLSSCETNIGLPLIFEDVYGNMSITMACKYAGARYVLGTQWEISDEYAKYFYKTFYEGLKTCGRIEDSFDNAVSKLRAMNDDPIVWGGFMLTK
jgi:CHAT domain